MPYDRENYLASYISSVAKYCNCSFLDVLNMPFDMVALCYKESYIDSLLSNETTKKKLKEYQFIQDCENGNYGDMEEEKLMKMFGGGK